MSATACIARHLHPRQNAEASDRLFARLHVGPASLTSTDGGSHIPPEARIRPALPEKHRVPVLTGRARSLERDERPPPLNPRLRLRLHARELTREPERMGTACRANRTHEATRLARDADGRSELHQRLVPRAGVARVHELPCQLPKARDPFRAADVVFDREEAREDLARPFPSTKRPPLLRRRCSRPRPRCSGRSRFTWRERWQRPGGNARCP